MFAILPPTTEAFVAVKVTGELHKADYDKLVPLLEEQIAAHGKIALYLEVQDFTSISAPALWADTKFDVRHARDFSRIALVGDEKWHAWAGRLMSPFTSAEVRVFAPAEKEVALTWARGDDRGV